MARIIRINLSKKQQFIFKIFPKYEMSNHEVMADDDLKLSGVQVKMLKIVVALKGKKVN